MANISFSSTSLLTEAPSDITEFAEAHIDMNKRLNLYTPTSPNDDTVDFLRQVFQQLPGDGKLNLALDICNCETDKDLRQTVETLETGLLFPLKASGGKTAPVTPNPRFGFDDSVDDLVSLDLESASREARLRTECLRRDGRSCVITGISDVDNPIPGSITGVLEAAHILPFALGSYRNETERLRNCLIWTNMFRYFPSLRSRLGFMSDDINRIDNVMMLLQCIHFEFGRFHISLAATDTENTYTIKTFRGMPTMCNFFLPPNGQVVLTSHDDRYKLPHPILLQVHNAVAHILHLTGRGEKAEKLQREYEDAQSLAPGGGSDVESLLAFSSLGVLASAETGNRQRREVGREETSSKERE